MIRDYEIGAVFAVIDDASAPLRKILESIREVNKAIKIAREGMAGFSAAVTPGIAGAILETNKLAGSWTRAAEASVAAAKVMRDSAAAAATAARTAAATSVPGVAAPVRGAGAAAVGGATAGGFRPGVGGRAAYLPHVTGSSIPLPTGGHMGLTGTPALIGAAAALYGITEASTMEQDAYVLNYHLGRPSTEKNNAEVRKIIEEGMVSTTDSLPDVAKAATIVAQQMRDVPGFDVLKELPEFLRAARREQIAKGTPLPESMAAIVGLSHMAKAWTPELSKKLFHVFAYLSTANPMSLAQEEKAFSYALPILQSGADVDPKDVMIAATELATSGVTSTKGGTWLREMVARMLPGKPEHNAQLKRLGLLDAEGKPTWFTGGKPDIQKGLAIAGPIAQAMPPEERLPFLRDTFGTRGSGAFAVLGNEQMIERARQLREGIENSGNRQRYETLDEDIRNNTTKGMARSTLQEFNVAMIELGTQGLPLATGALKGFSEVLGWFMGGHKTKEDKTFKPNWMENLHEWMPWSGASSLPKPQKQSFLQGPPITLKPQPISLSLNVDGRALAQTVSEQLQDLTEHATSGPNYNELIQFPRADGGITTE